MKGKCNRITELPEIKEYDRQKLYKEKKKKRKSECMSKIEYKNKIE